MKNADNFFIDSTEPADPLQDYLGMPLEVIVNVINERESNIKISNIQK